MKSNIENEQKGLEVLLKESEGRIQVPLMMSIDHQGNLSFLPNPFLFFSAIDLILFSFEGYRLVAQSLLPIKSNTLIYGSKDGGVTIDTGDKYPEFKPLIEDIASKKNNSEFHFSLQNKENKTDFPFLSFCCFEQRGSI